MDKIEELKKLKGLLDNGFITQEEFITLKDEIVLRSASPKKEPDLKPEILSSGKDKLETNLIQESISSKTIENKKEQSEEEDKRERNEIEKEERTQDVTLKCKKCDKEISEYLNESNKGLCVECKEKGIQIPKWAYLFYYY